MNIKEVRANSIEEFERKLDKEMFESGVKVWNPLWETFEHRSWSEYGGRLGCKIFEKEEYYVLLVRNQKFHNP